MVKTLLQAAIILSLPIVALADGIPNAGTLYVSCSREATAKGLAGEAAQRFISQCIAAREIDLKQRSTTPVSTETPNC